MKSAIKIGVVVLLAAIAFASCKSSCECFKHSYGQNSTEAEQIEKA